MESFDTFQDALASTGFEDPEAAMSAGYSVCGVYLDENTPKYFVVDESDEVEPHDAAFEIRHGRPMTDYERWCMEMAQQFKGVPA